MGILELLKEKNLFDEQQLAEVTAASEQGLSALQETLLKHGTDPEALLFALGEYYRLPTRMLGEREVVLPEVLRYVPEESSRHYRFVPLEEKDGILEIGITDPDNLTALDALNFISSRTGLPHKLVLILDRDLERVFKMYENLTGEVTEALSELETDLTTDIEQKTAEAAPKEPDREEVIKEDAPVSRIVATILRYAVDGRASDIHIEPIAEKVRVRFRTDGVLVTSIELPIKTHPAMVARIKILASLRLDEKRKPQDGRFSAKFDERKIDFRVSTLPTYHGEKVVMRILDPDAGVRSLEDIGISEYNLSLIREAIRQPYGIVLISGPTGSGKSTTLYAMLAEVDRAGKNVISLEDPVEYQIEGVSQSQIRPEIGYTFASGLRTVLRQDPNIIMVGEIRDKETAQLAIQAALTGHLVLTTIHTNNSLGVIPRLVDMGVDPYLIAPTLILAMAQRLVKRICPNAGREIQIQGSLKAMLDDELKDLPQKFRARIPETKSVLYSAATPDCPNGTRGRMAVMEVIQMTEDLEPLILKNAGEEELYKVARTHGFLSMREDAILKALRHEIPFEEVNMLGGALMDFDPDVEPEIEKEQGHVNNTSATKDKNAV